MKLPDKKMAKFLKEEAKEPQHKQSLGKGKSSKKKGKK